MSLKSGYFGIPRKDLIIIQIICRLTVFVLRQIESINLVLKRLFANQKSTKQVFEYLALDSIAISTALQVPVSQRTRLDYKRCQKLINKLSITDIRIVPEKYWIREDLRRFLVPLQFDKTEKFSRIIRRGGHQKLYLLNPDKLLHIKSSKCYLFDGAELFSNSSINYL